MSGTFFDTLYVYFFLFFPQRFDKLITVNQAGDFNDFDSKLLIFKPQLPSKYELLTLFVLVIY